MGRFKLDVGNFGGGGFGFGNQRSRPISEVKTIFS